MKRIIFLIFIIFIINLSMANAKSPPPGNGGSSVRSNVLIMLDVSGSMNNIAIPEIDMETPNDLAFNSKGDLIVADNTANNIQIFDSSGRLISTFGEYNSDSSVVNGKFKYIYSVAVDSEDNIYVSDQGEGIIQIFSPSGVYKSQITLSTPSFAGAIRIDSQNNIYVVNGDGKIEKYDSSGNRISIWNNAPANFISIDRNDNLYLTTQYQGNANHSIFTLSLNQNFVYKYDNNGNYLSSFTLNFGSNGIASGINVNYDGTIYVADSFFLSNLIHQYDANGNEIAVYGNNSISFSAPQGMISDTYGNLWIADSGNSQIDSLDGTVFNKPTQALTEIQLITNAINAVVANSGLSENANFGLMTWSSDPNGGNLIVPISNQGASLIPNALSAYTCDKPTTITCTPPAGSTIISSAMLTAKQYFSGQYNGLSSPINPNAKDCQQNIIILMSDGGWDQQNGQTANNLAAQLYSDYGVKTFAVGILTGNNPQYVDISQAGGSYPLSPLYASNTQELIDNLTAYISRSIATTLTFSAPTIIPGFKDNGSLIQSVFEYSSIHQWKGHLYKYKLDSEGNISTLVWDAGALLNQTSADSRKIWTAAQGLSNSLNNFTLDNIKLLAPPLELNLSQPLTQTTLSKLISFVRGKDAFSEFAYGIDSDGDSLLAGERWKLADIYHSQAISVGPTLATVSNSSNIYTEDYYRFVNGYSQFQQSGLCGTNCLERQEVIYVGNNDGMLHAFDSKTGEELWAFIPPSILPRLNEMMSTDTGTSTSIYGVDGSPVVKDIFYDNSWHTVLLCGLRQGGNSYFALDVTNPNSPKHLFTFLSDPVNNLIRYWSEDGTLTSYSTAAGATNPPPSNMDFSGLGETWSTPNIVKIELNGKTTWVAIFGGGYNNKIANYGSNLFIINMEKGGEIIKKLTVADSTNSVVNSVPPTVTVINSDSTTSFNNPGALVYFSDLQGKLWKVSLLNDSSIFNMTKLFDAQSTVDNERLNFSPVASAINNTGQVHYYYGTGDITNLDSLSANIQNQVFSIKDANFPNYTNTSTLTTNNLVNALGSCPTSSDNGWYANIPSFAKVTGQTSIYHGTLFVPEYIPDSTNICSGGTGSIVEYSFDCGTKIRTTSIGSGTPTSAVLYNNKIYVGVSTNQKTGTLENGFVKTGNVVVGTPATVKKGTVSIKSWREIFK